MKNPVVQQPAPPEPYTRPEVLVYGDIRQVTQANGLTMGAFDGVVTNGNQHKTQ